MKKKKVFRFADFVKPNASSEVRSAIVRILNKAGKDQNELREKASVIRRRATPLTT